MKNNEIKDSFKAKGLAKAKEILRVDNLSIDEKIAYDIFVKNQRILQSEITTARTDAEYKYKVKLEEAVKQKEEERRQKEEERRQKEEAREKEREAREKEREAREKEREARQKEREAKKKLAQAMLKYNEPIEKIIKETGLTEEQIRKL